MYEVEQKYHIQSVAKLIQAIESLGATAMATETHVDNYYNHPSRDFAQSREALRVRRVDGVPMITYKGPKLEGKIKAREEMEWRLDPGDHNGSQTERLLIALGFRWVKSVKKTRQPYRMQASWDSLTVVLDQVQELGDFAEIEKVVADRDSVPAARKQIQQLAELLELRKTEARSYLTMLLENEN